MQRSSVKLMFHQSTHVDRNVIRLSHAPPHHVKILRISARRLALLQPVEPSKLLTNCTRQHAISCNLAESARLACRHVSPGCMASVALSHLTIAGLP